MIFVRKECLFCGEQEEIEEMYSRSFHPEDMTPEAFSALRDSTRYHHTIVRCRTCGLVFSRDVFPEETLQELYRQGNQHLTAYTGFMGEDYWLTLAPHVRGRKKESAMDIGCGDGFFLTELRAQGYREVYGCEPNAEARAKTPPPIRSTILAEFFREGLFLPEQFDLVCSFHTLDHVMSPVAFLRGVRNIVRSDGLVYVVTHDIASVQARIFGKRSPIIDVGHVYLYTPDTLARLFRETGFRVIAQGQLANRYPLEYWWRFFPAPPLVKRAGMKFLSATGTGRLRPPLRAGNIFLIAQRTDA